MFNLGMFKNLFLKKIYIKKIDESIMKTKIIINALYMDPLELNNCLHDRAMFAPTLDVVDGVNQFMISLDQSQGRIYHRSL